MAFSIARQPLVPAFLTLLAITVAATWRIGDAGAAGVAGVASSIIAEASAAVTLLPAAVLGDFQAAHPQASHYIAAFMLLFSGLCLGRLSTRYGLYGMHCCLAIPLYGIVACGILPHADYLAAFAASLLLTLSTQSFCCSYRSGYAFDAIFRASLYLGLVPFVYPCALPLVLLLPLVVLIFRRTLRELTVALTGLLLPAFVICYVAWGLGYDFTAPLQELANLAFAGEPLQFFTSASIPILAGLGTAILLMLMAVFVFLPNAYATGSRPRLILIYNIVLFLLTATILASPAATNGITALLAVPAALFLPVLFIHIHHTIATPVYLLLLAGTFAGIFLL